MYFTQLKTAVVQLFRNVGEVTQAEQFIDWTDEDLFPGSAEVIRLAKHWSVDPIYTDHPGDRIGMLGYKHF